MNLLTLSDGFGDSWAVPDWYPDYVKWPEIVAMMTRGVKLRNLSRYGAGNEFIVHRLKENLQHQDLVMVQWAPPDRLDLLLTHSDDFWDPHIASDPVYGANIIDSTAGQFWLSSGSCVQPVVQYRDQLISMQQHQLRSQMFVEYAKMLLNQQDIEYRFMLTIDAAYLDHMSTDNWLWHRPWHGMNDFRYHSRFSELDLDIVQPIPLISFDFVQQFIMPTVDLPWRSARDITAVENVLYKKYTQSVKNRPYDTNS